MNENILTLNKLSQGQKAQVKSLALGGAIRRRLQDMGLIEGTQIECLQKSPAGDPVAYFIRGAVIALRSEDSAGIWVEAI
jgi:ferrous iron transport protein A